MASEIIRAASRINDLWTGLERVDGKVSKAKHYEGLTVALRSLASGLTTDELRSSLGQTSIFSVCAACLGEYQTRVTGLQELALEICRVIGNACFDHDENRSASLDAGIPGLVLEMIASTLPQRGDADELPLTATILELKLLRAAVGALLNVSLNYAPIKAVLNTPESLSIFLSLLDCRTGSTVTEPVYVPWSWSRECSAPEWKERINIGALIVSWTMNILTDVIKPDGTTFPRDSIDALTSIILAPIGPLATGAGLQSQWEADQLVDFIESDLDLMTQASKLLETLAIEGYVIAAVDSGQKIGLADVLDFIEFAAIPIALSSLSDDPDAVHKQFSAMKSKMIGALIEAPNSVTVMHQLFAEKDRSIIVRLIGWLSRPQKGREDMLICATHFLAALGRQDDYCIEFIGTYHLAPILAQLTLDRLAPASPSSSTSRPGETVQILFGLVSFLRHLAIPAQNKSIIGETGVMLPLMNILRTGYDVVSPLQNAVVGLIKQLTSSNFDNSLLFLIDATALHVLLDLVDRTDDVRLKSETIRILINLIKSLYASRSTPFAAASTTVLAADTVGAKVLLQDERVIVALGQLARTSGKYSMLVNEAIVGMTLLAASATASAQLVAQVLIAETTHPTASITALDSADIVEGPSPSPAADTAANSALDVLVQWFSSDLAAEPTLRPEMLANACILLHTVMERTAGVTDEQADEFRAILRRKVKLPLDRLVDAGHEDSLKTAVTSLLVRLQ